MVRSSSRSRYRHQHCSLTPYLLINPRIGSVRHESKSSLKVTAKGTFRASVRVTGSKIAWSSRAHSVVSVLAPYVSPYGPDEIYDKWSAPSASTCSEPTTSAVTSSRASCTVDVLADDRLCSTLIALCFGAIIGSVRPSRKSFWKRSCASWTSSWRSRYRHGGRFGLVFGRTLSESGNTFGLVFVIICSIAFVYHIPQLSRIVRANVMAAYGETTSVR